MVVAAGWWVAIVELWPASSRPYIGGSQNNSFLELTFGYNGLGRINGDETGSVGGGGGGGGGGMWGETGWYRMFNSSIGGQISWLHPGALILLVGRPLAARPAPRTDLRRAAFLVWGGWLLVTVRSSATWPASSTRTTRWRSPPRSAPLVGMGADEAWQRRWRGVARSPSPPRRRSRDWSFLLLDAPRLASLAAHLGARRSAWRPRC